MQAHYVIGFDSDKGKWFVDHSLTYDYLDGNMYEENGEGFFWADEEHEGSEALDYGCLKTLEYIIDTLPAPLEV